MLRYPVILRRALTAGGGAGVLVAVFYLLVAEPTIDAAIALEGSAGDHDELFSREVQVLGGVSAAVLFGLLLGVVFGTVVAAVRHRLGFASDLHRVLALAAAGFVATALLPAIKYPPNPPGVGDPDTVGHRTTLYLTLVLAGLVLAVGLAMAHRTLRYRFGADTAVALTAVATLAGYGLLVALWPDSPDQVPADFPPVLLWEFRVQSLASLLLLWSTLGLGLGWSLTRLRPDPTTADEPAPATTGG
jgi:predicted cobalt transporter CbtA